MWLQICRPTKRITTLLAYSYNNKITHKQYRPEPPQNNKERTMRIYQEQEDLVLAEEVTAMPLKVFAVKVHHLLVAKQKSPLFWGKVESQLLSRLHPTTDKQIIRSYSKLVYSLSKSHQSKANYETQLAVMLPFASPQSFTTIVTSLSRMGPFSQQFGYIVQNLYYKRKAEFRVREVISINYSMVRNGRKVDKGIIQLIDCMNCGETVTMLRCYDMSQETVDEQLLKKVLAKIKSVKAQMNVLDLTYMLPIYLKHKFTGHGFEELMEESYRLLRRNIDEESFWRVWQELVPVINQGIVRVSLVEQVVETLLILRKGGNMGEVVWKKVQDMITQITNLELRVRLQKIY